MAAALHLTVVSVEQQPLVWVGLLTLHPYRWWPPMSLVAKHSSAWNEQCSIERVNHCVVAIHFPRILRKPEPSRLCCNFLLEERVYQNECLNPDCVADAQHSLTIMRLTATCRRIISMKYWIQPAIVTLAQSHFVGFLLIEIQYGRN